MSTLHWGDTSIVESSAQCSHKRVHVKLQRLVGGGKLDRSMERNSGGEQFIYHVMCRSTLCKNACVHVRACSPPFAVVVSSTLSY